MLFAPIVEKPLVVHKWNFAASFNGCHLENGREMSNFDNKSEGLG